MCKSDGLVMGLSDVAVAGILQFVGSTPNCIVKCSRRRPENAFRWRSGNQIENLSFRCLGNPKLFVRIAKKEKLNYAPKRSAFETALLLGASFPRWQ